MQKKVHNTTEAEDLTQEILLKIYQKINDLMFHNPKNPVGWFIRVAQNHTRNYLTKKRLELESYSEVGMYVKYKDNGEEYDVSEKVIYNDWLESERLAIQ